MGIHPIMLLRISTARWYTKLTEELAEAYLRLLHLETKLAKLEAIVAQMSIAQKGKIK